MKNLKLFINLKIRLKSIKEQIKGDVESPGIEYKLIIRVKL